MNDTHIFQDNMKVSVNSCPDAVVSSQSLPSFVHQISKMDNHETNNYPSLISPESLKKKKVSVVKMSHKSSSYNSFIQAFHKIREETSQISEIVLTHEATCINQRLAKLQTKQKRTSITNTTMELSSANKRRKIITSSSTETVYITDIPSNKRRSSDKESVPLTITTTTTPCRSIVSDDNNSDDHDHDNDSLTTTSICSELDHDNDEEDMQHQQQHKIDQLQQMVYKNQILYEKNEILMKAYRMKNIANIFHQIQTLQNELLNEMNQSSS